MSGGWRRLKPVVLGPPTEVKPAWKPLPAEAFPVTVTEVKPVVLGPPTEDLDDD